MIILDTNIVSEFMGAPPNPTVLAWLKTIPIHEICITTLQTAEIMKGLVDLPEGRRRDGLFRDYRAFRSSLPNTNILPFDEAAAIEFGVLWVHRARLGRRIQEVDAQIAAIARARGCRLATHDTQDFMDCGLILIDPFTHRA